MYDPLYYKDEFKADLIPRRSDNNSCFLTFEGLTVKDQEKLKDKLESDLGFKIRVTRSSGVTRFLTSEDKKEICMKKAFDNYSYIATNYKFDVVNFDFTTVDTNNIVTKEEKRRRKKR